MRILTALLISLLGVTSALAQDASFEVTVEDLYYDARALLREGAYLDSADAFGTLAENHRDHELAPKALYWRAFALSREGERWDLIEAKNTLELLFERYPEPARRGDAAELAVEIRSGLAQLGDAEAAREIAELADAIRGDEPTTDAPDRSDRESSRMNEETRLAALNALLQMSPERAMPILRKVLVEKPEAYSAEFRERAVFLLSQNDTGDETLATFKHVIAEDPDLEVREQAVFWLSQINDDRAVGILEKIALDTREDREIRDKAIFALSQIGGSRANEILRDIAENPDNDTELRSQAVFWIGQSNDRSAFDFLVELFGKIDDAEVKDKTIFAISQIGGPRATSFFTDVVRDADESTEIRKQALFWMSQMGGNDVDPDAFVDLFHSIDDREVREQAIFALSQLGRGRGIDALIDIARDADDHELREKAIFWLGQSDDDRALDFLTTLIGEDF